GVVEAVANVVVRRVVRVVVDVRDVGDVRDPGVIHIHVPEIVAAHVVRRNVRFAVAQREPAYPWSAKRKADAPMIAVVYPTAIVARCKSPGRVIHPSPSPRVEPYPMAVAIGCPARRNRRNPDRTVGGNYAPGSVIIQIIRANHVRRNIAVGSVALLATITNSTPVVETVALRRVLDVMTQGSPAAETGLIATANFHGATFPGSV